MRNNDERRSLSATNPAIPRLRRRTLRQLTLVELGKVAAGRRPTPCTSTTGIENECLTRDTDP
jgi:hypothetical protein